MHTSLTKLMSPVSPVAANSGLQSDGCLYPVDIDKHDSDQQNYRQPLKSRRGGTSATLFGHEFVLENNK